MSKANDPVPRIRYRCRACGRTFEPQTHGVAPCPRCQAVGDHAERAARPPGGTPDGR